MRNLVIFFWASVYLISTFGANVILHYCGSQLKYVQILVNDKEDQGCCSNKTKNRKCCSEKTLSFKIKNLHNNLKTTLDFEVPQSVDHSKDFTSAVTSKSQTNLNILGLNFFPDHPPKSGKHIPIYLVNRVFII